jgi:hypothetical protein
MFNCHGLGAMLDWRWTFSEPSESLTKNRLRASKDRGVCTEPLALASEARAEKTLDELYLQSFNIAYGSYGPLK